MSAWCTKIQKLGKGIGSATRYQILQILMDGKKSVTDIVSEVKLSQPAVSQHLRTLRSCALVQSSKQGQEVYYALNGKYMIGLLKHLTSGVTNCKALKPAKVAKKKKQCLIL